MRAQSFGDSYRVGRAARQVRTRHLNGRGAAQTISIKKMAQAIPPVRLLITKISISRPHPVAERRKGLAHTLRRGAGRKECAVVQGARPTNLGFANAICPMKYRGIGIRQAALRHSGTHSDKTDMLFLRAAFPSPVSSKLYYFKWR